MATIDDYGVASGSIPGRGRPHLGVGLLMAGHHREGSPTLRVIDRFACSLSPGERGQIFFLGMQHR